MFFRRSFFSPPFYCCFVGPGSIVCSFRKSHRFVWTSYLRQFILMEKQKCCAERRHQGATNQEYENRKWFVFCYVAHVSASEAFYMNGEMHRTIEGLRTYTRNKQRGKKSANKIRFLLTHQARCPELRRTEPENMGPASALKLTAECWPWPSSCVCPFGYNVI